MLSIDTIVPAKIAKVKAVFGRFLSYYKDFAPKNALNSRFSASSANRAETA